MIDIRIGVYALKRAYHRIFLQRCRMTFYSVFIAVVFAAFAVSYGWGMRGCVIGGEKGALVPGALLGLSISLFCGDGALIPYFPFFCAAGALGMTFGGIEPYAQTMSYILHREKEPFHGHYLKGCIGIFLKGALWFGMAGGVLGILPAALAGEYKAEELALLFAAVPVASFVGTLIFNSPYNKEKGIFPKLYFSTSSREEWGGNVFAVLTLAVFAAVKKNFFALGSVAVGLIFGGIGFLVGLLIYDFTVRKHGKKQRYPFGSLQEKGYIDGWKIMEHTFGAISGGAVMLYFCLNSEKLCASFGRVQLESLAFGGKKDGLAMIAVLVMLALSALQYVLIPLLEKGGFAKIDSHWFELFERPLWASFALIFILGGSVRASLAAAFVTVAYALVEKGIDWFSCYKKKTAVIIGLCVFFVGVLVYFFAGTVTPAVLAVLYTFIYIAVSLLYFFMPERVKKLKENGRPFSANFGSSFTVHGHFLIQAAVITAVTVLMMR